MTDRPGHDRRYAIDPTLISNELGWQPPHSFEEGLAATVRWYLEQLGWGRWRQQPEPIRGRTHAKQELGFRVKLILELRSWLLA